jgi:hypothetical protein
LPRSLEFADDQLYFTGADPSGMAGVFQVAAAGGALTAMATGDPFSEPSGIAIAGSGDVYVVDTGKSTAGAARIIRIANGVASVFLDGLSVGYPAGVVVSMDDSLLLLSALDPITGTDTIAIIDKASKNLASVNAGISAFTEPAGLHRAKTKDVFAWADSTANQTGTVYLVSR